jgi:hypothetical protein
MPDAAAEGGHGVPLLYGEADQLRLGESPARDLDGDGGATAVLLRWSLRGVMGFMAGTVGYD